MPKHFSSEYQPATRGRQKGTPNRTTALHQQLMELLPEAIKQLADRVRAGDPKLMTLYFTLALPPQKAVYPQVAINTDSPRATVAVVKEALSAGDISVDHANAILDLLVKVQRIETGIALTEAKVINSTPLETAQTVISTAVATGDLSTVMEATRNALPYTAPKPQPEPPEPTGRVEAEPLELSPEEWEDKYGNNA